VLKVKKRQIGRWPPLPQSISPPNRRLLFGTMRNLVGSNRPLLSPQKTPIGGRAHKEIDDPCRTDGFF
jgi:hypothetical protein